jgi:hypothetical protein
MPPDGGIVRPHDAPMEPFFFKLKFNASLDVRVLVGPLRVVGHGSWVSG